MTDFTSVIQGPLNEISLNNLENYLKFGKVIISHWASDSFELVREFDNVIYVSQTFPGKNIPDGCDPASTFYWAVRSTHLGIIMVDSEYVIKTRSDEFFSDLNPLIEQVLENDEKLVCGNIFYRKHQDIPCHIGDHLFAAKTSTLKSAYQDLIKEYHSGEVSLAYRQQRGWSAEQIVAAAFLRQKEVNLAPRRPVDIEIVKEHFDVIDVNLLGDYKVRWGHKNLDWENNFSNQWGINSIEDVI